MGEPAGERCPASPTEGRSSVSTEQKENLDAILRQSAFPAGSDVGEQRRLLRELTAAQPLPAGVTVTAAELGGVPAADDALAAYQALLRGGTPPRASRSPASRPAAGSPSPPWSTPATTGCRCPPRPSSCPRTPTSPWPGRPWKPSARPTRCSPPKHSRPGSPTTRRA